MHRQPSNPSANAIQFLRELVNTNLSTQTTPTNKTTYSYEDFEKFIKKIEDPTSTKSHLRGLLQRLIERLETLLNAPNIHLANMGDLNLLGTSIKQIIDTLTGFGIYIAKNQKQVVLYLNIYLQKVIPALSTDTELLNDVFALYTKIHRTFRAGQPRPVYPNPGILKPAKPNAKYDNKYQALIHLQTQAKLDCTTSEDNDLHYLALAALQMENELKLSSNIQMPSKVISTPDSYRYLKKFCIMQPVDNSQRKRPSNCADSQKKRFKPGD